MAAKSLSGGQGAARVDQVFRRHRVIFQEIVFKEDIVVQQSEVLEFVIKNGGQAKVFPGDGR